MNEQPESVDPDEYLRRLQEAADKPQPTAPYQAAPGQPAPYQLAPYQQAGYQPAAYPPPAYPPYAPPPVDHPAATTSMVLGIVGLASIAIFCGVGLVVSPFAWVMGSRAVAQIDADPSRFRGRDRASAGKVMGIVGTVLLAVGLVALALFIAVLYTSGPAERAPDVTVDTSQDARF